MYGLAHDLCCQSGLAHLPPLPDPERTECECCDMPLHQAFDEDNPVDWIQKRDHQTAMRKAWEMGAAAGADQSFAARCAWLLCGAFGGFLCGAAVAAVVAWAWK